VKRSAAIVGLVLTTITWGCTIPLLIYLVTVGRYPTGIFFVVPFYALIRVGAIRVFWPHIRKNPRYDQLLEISVLIPAFTRHHVSGSPVRVTMGCP